MVKEVGLVKRKIKKVKSTLRDAKRKLALEQAMAKEPKEIKPGAKMSKEEIKESEKKVGVRDFRLADSKDPSRLQVQFTIFNKDSYRSIVNGRIIVVASKETVEPYFYVSYPQTSLKGGEPTNPNTGYRFAIRKFKQIKGQFKRPSMEICFDHVSIFLYSPKGTLILREKFSIDENFCKENKITLSR